MADTPQLTIEIQLDDGSIKKGVANLPSHFKEPGKKAGEELGDGISSGVKSKMEGVKSFLTNPATLGLAAIAASVATIMKVVDVMKEGIGEAAQEADAVNRLGAALRQTGQYSEATAESLNKFATEMQKTTRFSDDAILGGMALLQTLTNLDEKGLKRATKAAADMSAGLGIDLQTAFMMVGKAAEGEIGTLGRYGIKVKEGATNAQTFENVLSTLEKKMGGRAAADVNTYTGSLTLMDNAYKNLLGTLGDFIVKSPLVIAFSKEMSRVLNEASDAIGEKSGNKSLMSSMTTDILYLGFALNSAVTKPLEIIFHLQNSISKAFLTMSSGLGFAASRIVADFASILPDAIVPESMKKKLYDTAEDYKNLTVRLYGEAGQEISNAVELPFASAIENSLLNMQYHVDQMAAASEAKKNETPTGGEAKTKEDSFSTEALMQIALFDKVSKASSKMKKEVTKDVTDISNAIKQGLASSISGGVQNIVMSIMNGQNAFANFAKFVLAAMGDMAIKLGEMFILKGIAIDAMKGLVGGAAVAAGISLVALGTIMKAYSGPMSGGSSTANGGMTPTYADTSGNNGAGPVSNTIKEEKQEPKTTVQVNIHGSVYDSQETGLRIVELMNEAISKNGARVYA